MTSPNREELIARAIHSVQGRNSSSGHTELAHLLSAPVFSSMPVEQKARVVAEYAKGVEQEPEPTLGEDTIRVAKGAFSGITGMAVPAALYGALPWSVGQLVKQDPASTREIGTKLLRATRRAGPYLGMIGAIGGAATAYGEIQRNAAARNHSNQILDRIHAARSPSDVDEAAYELLAGSPHYLNVRDRSALASKAKRGETVNKMNTLYSSVLKEQSDLFDHGYDEYGNMMESAVAAAAESMSPAERAKARLAEAFAQNNPNN